MGVNCSTGPEQMAELVREMKAYANIPVIAKPNDGMPEVIDGETVYRMTPEEFAAEARLILEAGAGIVGGCCGTTPEHIRAFEGRQPRHILYRQSAKHTNVYWLRNVRHWKSKDWMPVLRLWVSVSIQPARRNCRQPFGKARWIWSWIWRWLRKRKAHRFWMSIWV